MSFLSKRPNSTATQPRELPSVRHGAGAALRKIRASVPRTRVLGAVAGCMLAGSLSAAPILQAPAGQPSTAAGQPRLLQMSPLAGRPVNSANGQLELTAGQTSATQSEVQRQLELLYQQNGRPAPEMINPGIVPQQPQGSSAPPSYRPAYQPPAAPPQPAGYPRAQAQAAPPKRSFLDRLLSPFRRDPVPAAPPVDPGIRYPTGPSAQSVVGRNSTGSRPAAPPAVPPVPPAQPGLLPSASASPINESPVMQGIVPPAPGGGATSLPGIVAKPVRPNPLASPPPVKPAQPGGNVRELPELKAMLQQQPAPKALQPAADAGQPQSPPKSLVNHAEPTDDFDFGQPFDVPEQVVDRRRDMEFDLNEALDGPLPDAEAPSAERAPSADVAGTVPPSPEDLEPQTGEEVIEKPYTGVTLEEDMFSKSAAMPPSEITFDFTSDDAAAGQPEEQRGTASLPTSVSAGEPLIPPLPDEGLPARDVKQEQSTAGNDTPLPPMPPSEQAETADASPKLEELPTLDFSLPAPDPNEPAKDAPKLQQAKVAGEVPQLTPPPSGSESARKRPANSSVQTKMARIAAREGTGLKGFCPVTLRDHRDLADALPEYSATFHGKTFFFASEAALATFLNNPLPYVPANGGNDVIHLALTGEELEGSLDNAVWYKGRLYLFSSVETMETFVAAPSSHAVPE